MFFQYQSDEVKSAYISYLRGIASLSRLFSDSSSPYIPYRASENIFCLAFGAKNVSRTDCSADAMKIIEENINLGFGIKTFLEKNNQSFEKVAEFNKDLTEEKRKTMSPEALVRHIAFLRNRRIESTCDLLGLNKLIYHCVVRNNGVIKIYEQNMDMIDLDQIVLELGSRHLHFADGQNEYQLNLTKSTLLKRFSSMGRELFSFEAKILRNPYDLIRSLGTETYVPEITIPPVMKRQIKRKATVYLPLYSPRDVDNPKVFPRSGLNQWNARGRSRHQDELYIPIPLWVHREFPEFFPDRDTPFELTLPNQNVLKAKVCQSDGKALMSDPNQALGHWLLRDVLRVKEGELVTYEDLIEIGIDTVEIVKHSDLSFEINFKKIGTYAMFAKKFE
ncbi:hypothetical protein [Pleomorphochaeta sp. DL1XJH-081]|uniref:hypothetical protein n=1 Tax=Pleomorphochaeta sp. DL1XJH-081 TaxID=3409690 RepID=UPI003BB4FD6F